MTILFWSGGKDSYFAYELLSNESDREIKFLTTYDEERNFIPHHRISLETIEEQARQMGVELITVALPPECPNEIYIERVQEALNRQDQPIEALAFGDWKNREIREWRDEVFRDKLGYECLFPIWKKSLHDLIPILTFKPIKVEISSVHEDYEDMLSVGEIYDQRLISQLPREIDSMGEYGEFHTVVHLTPLETAN